MLNWQFGLLQKLLTNWKAAAHQSQNQYQRSEEELAALDWFITLSDLGEQDRFWLVQAATTFGLTVQNLLELQTLAARLLLPQP
jgi:hypothetical protein